MSIYQITQVINPGGSSFGGQMKLIFWHKLCHIFLEIVQIITTIVDIQRIDGEKASP